MWIFGLLGELGFHLGRRRDPLGDVVARQLAADAVEWVLLVPLALDRVARWHLLAVYRALPFSTSWALASAGRAMNAARTATDAIRFITRLLLASERAHIGSATSTTAPGPHRGCDAPDHAAAESASWIGRRRRIAQATAVLKEVREQ